MKPPLFHPPPDASGALCTFVSHAALHRTLGDIPDLSAQHCRAWASAKVSSCLVTLKSLMLGDQCRVGSPNDTIHKGYMGAYHHPDASSWAMGSQKAIACPQASCRAWKSPPHYTDPLYEDQNLIRLIKESMYIRVNNLSLKINIGKYHLLHIWDEVLLNNTELKLK